MQDGGPRPRSVGPKKRTAQKNLPNKDKAVAALTGGSERRSGEALRSCPAACDRATLSQQRQESDEQ
eukprot:6178879-Pleurochrysis_carterae.AAC.1